MSKMYYHKYKFGDYTLIVNISRKTLKVYFKNYDRLITSGHSEIYHILYHLAKKLPLSYLAEFERILIDLIDEKVWLNKPKEEISESDLLRIKEIRKQIKKLKIEIVEITTIEEKKEDLPNLANFFMKD